MNGSTVDKTDILTLVRQYGEYEGTMMYHYATRFAALGNTLTHDQADTVMGLRLGYYERFPDYQANPNAYECSGAWLYASRIDMPDIMNTDFLFGVGDAPIPDIKANGSDGPLTLSSGDMLTISISLDTGAGNGRNADWWILAETPMGWYYYVYPGMWHIQGSSGADPLPAYEGPLLDLVEPLQVLGVTGLPAGEYVFYFGVDTTVNGLVDMETIFYDWAAVEIVAAVP
jgi:hypothetical protein